MKGLTCRKASHEHFRENLCILCIISNATHFYTTREKLLSNAEFFFSIGFEYILTVILIHMYIFIF